jgi:hypothetical protein
LEIPAGASAVRRLLGRLGVEPLGEKVQAAHRVDLVFRADELGASSLTFPREVEPLRWKLERKGAGRQVRLIDEAGGEETPRVERYDMGVPDRREVLDLNQCLAGIAVEPPGSLFVARQGKRSFLGIASVPAQERLRTFSELGISVSFNSAPNDPRRIPYLLALQRRWARARAFGPLGTVRKAQVLEAFDHQIIVIACGAIWADRFRECRGGNRGLLDRLQRDVGGSPGFASRMRHTDWSGRRVRASNHHEFLRIAKTYGVSARPELCELAMRLAFHRESIRLVEPDKLLPTFEELVRNPVLVKGAFLAKISTEMRQRDGTSLSGGEAA